MSLMRFAFAVMASTAAASLYTPCATVTAADKASMHVMENASAARWGQAPPMLPPGAQIAVLAGDPTKAAPYTVRLKFPANYFIPAHSHPEDENVLVVSGELFIHMGAGRDRTGATGLTPGGFALMPTGAVHSAYTTGETTILLYGQGPVEFKYVNPADDPRHTTSTRK